MNVVIVSQWFPPEKVELPFDVAESLARFGHEVTVLTGFPNYPLGRIYSGWRQQPKADSRVGQLRVRRVAAYPSHDRSALRRMASYLSFAVMSTIFGWSLLRRADVIYVYHPPLSAALGPWLSRRLGGAPYVLHVQDLWPESVLESGIAGGGIPPRPARLFSSICDVLYRRASAIVCISPTMARLLSVRSVPSDHLHVIENWADESIFFPIPVDREYAQETKLSLGIASCFSVMFAGNVGYLQGLDVAIAAAAEVQDLTDFRLVIVGGGIAHADLHAMAQRLGTNNVSFIPARPAIEMNAISAAATVQLVSLQDRPFLDSAIPSKLTNMLASGVPVICSANGDAGELVRRAGAGWTAPAGDVTGLAAAFRSAHAARPDELAALGANGRLYYESNLRQEAALGRIRSVLERSARCT